MEQYVRTKIDTQLHNLGWHLTGARQNVFQEEPRTKEERKRLGGNRPDYVLYSSDFNWKDPIAIIETKSVKVKGLDGAIEQAEGYAGALNAPIVFATDGIFYKAEHAVFKRPLILNSEPVDSLVEENIAVEFRDKWEFDERPPQVQISQSKLIDIFSDVNSILRRQGLIAGYERFSEFATILFLKLFSEKELQRKKPRISRIYTWDHLKTLNSNELLSYVSKSVFPEIARLYKDDKIFDSKLHITDPNIFREIYDKLDPLQLTYVNEDIKGGAFEYFLANSPSADKDLGEYFTPRHVIKTMVSILDPKLYEKIYDPFCGTGGMLIESYKHIGKNMESTKENTEVLQKSTLYGNEITSNSKIAKMNMILAGDGHSNIVKCDSLSPENLFKVEDKFDVVITNFPFSQTTNYSRYYDIPSKNGDSICLQHCLRAMKNGGRMAIVVPEGLLFKKDLEKTREFLLGRCSIDNIISLPSGVFEPYTNAETHIVYCTKKNPTKSIWFFQVKNDGYSLDKRRVKLGAENRSDLDKFLSFWKVGEKDRKKFGFFKVGIGDIEKKSHILIGGRYRSDLDELENFVSLRDVIKRNKTVIEVKDNKKYKRIKISLYGKGCSLRDEVKGSEIGTKKQFLVKKGQFVLSKIDARNGAFGFINDKLDGAIITGNFWAYDINEEMAYPEYLAYLFSTEQFTRFCKNKSSGLTNRKYLNEEEFLNSKIPLPKLEEQKDFLEKVAIHNKHFIESRKQIENLRSTLEETWENT